MVAIFPVLYLYVPLRRVNENVHVPIYKPQKYKYIYVSAHKLCIWRPNADVMHHPQLWLTVFSEARPLTEEEALPFGYAF